MYIVQPFNFGLEKIPCTICVALFETLLCPCQRAGQLKTYSLPLSFFYMQEHLYSSSVAFTTTVSFVPLLLLREINNDELYNNVYILDLNKRIQLL